MLVNSIKQHLKNKGIWMMIGLFMVMLLMSACSDLQSDQSYDPQLVTYLPEHTYAYYGDNQYYHQALMVESQTFKDHYDVTVSGEIKNNYKGTNADDFTYQQHYKVDHDAIWLTNEGEHLNDSSLATICVLKLPLEEGNQWSFKTQDKDGKTLTVEAEITSLSGDTVTVNYQIDKESFETRTLIKGLGTTEFEKHYRYKGAEGITGYHINREETDSDDVVPEIEEAPSVNEDQAYYEGIESAPVDESVKALLRDFNEQWVLYSKGLENNLNDLILLDSPAYEKMMQVNQDEDSEITFIDLKFLKVDSVNQLYDLIEVYQSHEQRLYNRVTYHLEAIDGDLKVKDFTSSNNQ